MKLMILRPYYGINIHSDMHGDLGVSDYLPHVFPDTYMVMGASLASVYPDVDLAVLDANAEKLFPKQVVQRIDPDFDEIVIKAAAPTVKYDLMLARALKKKYPSTRIVLAGHAALILAAWVQQHVIGVEVAAEPLDDYIHHRLSGKSGRFPLDHYPTPDYRLFPYKQYVDFPDRDLHTKELRGTLLTSRGCAMGCGYCPYTTYYKSTVDFRSVDNIIRDIRSLLDLGFTTIQFRDQFFTANHAHVEELCRAILDNKLHFSWKCETRLESLTTDLIDLMAEAGLKIIFIGIESASDATLKNFNRYNSITREKMRFLIDYLSGKRVITGGFYIIGFPDDTWNTIQDTLNFAVSLKTSFAKFSLFSLYPTQKIWEQRYADLSVTPDLFREFENTLTVNLSKNLTPDELHYTELMTTMLFYNALSGLEYTHRAFYAARQIFYESIERLKHALSLVPISEFDGMTTAPQTEVLHLAVVEKTVPKRKTIPSFS